MKTALHMFTLLGSPGTKVPFALNQFVAATPAIGDKGTYLYGVGLPVPIAVNETINQVNEIVGEWFNTNSAALIGGARG